MDPREDISRQFSARYYMPRGMPAPGPESQGPFGVRSISNMLNVSYQPNMGADSFSSALQPEPSSTISSHGMNVAATPIAAPQAEVARRKRGRPRKYGPDSSGNASLALSPLSSVRSVGSNPTGKRGRGRPPGTGRKKQLASMGDWLSGSAGTSFTPHVITVAGGEDIATKVMSFSQQSSRAICVLSASGAVSTVTLLQPSTSGGTVTYEGLFEILCLSGSYLLSNNGGSGGHTDGLSVSLSSPDGRVVGGGVGGVLIAASHVQVIVASFMWGNSKTKKIKARLNDGEELEHQTPDGDPAVPANVTRNQNLSASPSVVVWPSSQSMDMQSAHMDIDLMRG